MYQHGLCRILCFLHQILCHVLGVFVAFFQTNCSIRECDNKQPISTDCSGTKFTIYTAWHDSNLSADGGSWAKFPNSHATITGKKNLFHIFFFIFFFKSERFYSIYFDLKHFQKCIPGVIFSVQNMQNMQPPRMPNSQYPNMGNSNQQNVHYQMAQPPTSQTYYNNPAMMYNPQANRPPSNPPLQPEKRVKKTIMIQDPNTGKDLTNEILHTRESKEGASHTSTPPSGQGSGSRGTPDTV